MTLAKQLSFVILIFSANFVWADTTASMNAKLKTFNTQLVADDLDYDFLEPLLEEISKLPTAERKNPEIDKQLFLFTTLMISGRMNYELEYLFDPTVILLKNPNYVLSQPDNELSIPANQSLACSAVSFIRDRYKDNIKKDMASDFIGLFKMFEKHKLNPNLKCADNTYIQDYVFSLKDMSVFTISEYNYLVGVFIPSTSTITMSEKAMLKEHCEIKKVKKKIKSEYAKEKKAAIEINIEGFYEPGKSCQVTIIKEYINQFGISITVNNMTITRIEPTLKELLIAVNTLFQAK